MKKITQGVVMKIPFPSKLPIKKQQKIAECLDGLWAKTNELKTVQLQTLKKFNALLPAILDQAFKGKL